MEKGVDQVVGYRQKKKGMSWCSVGSQSLAILKVVELNGQWAPTVVSKCCRLNFQIFTGGKILMGLVISRQIRSH